MLLYISTENARLIYKCLEQEMADLFGKGKEYNFLEWARRFQNKPTKLAAALKELSNGQIMLDPSTIIFDESNKSYTVSTTQANINLIDRIIASANPNNDTMHLGMSFPRAQPPSRAAASDKERAESPDSRGSNLTPFFNTLSSELDGMLKKAREAEAKEAQQILITTVESWLLSKTEAKDIRVTGESDLIIETQKPTYIIDIRNVIDAVMMDDKNKCDIKNNDQNNTYYIELSPTIAKKFYDIISADVTPGTKLRPS